MSTIAAKCQVSRTFVELILKRESASRGRRVEKELAALECPGFEEFRPARRKKKGDLANV